MTKTDNQTNKKNIVEGKKLVVLDVMGRRCVARIVKECFYFKYKLLLGEFQTNTPTYRCKIFQGNDHSWLSCRLRRRIFILMCAFLVVDGFFSPNYKNLKCSFQRTLAIIVQIMIKLNKWIDCAMCIQLLSEFRFFCDFYDLEWNHH